MVSFCNRKELLKGKEDEMKRPNKIDLGRGELLHEVDSTSAAAAISTCSPRHAVRNNPTKIDQQLQAQPN